MARKGIRGNVAVESNTAQVWGEKAEGLSPLAAALQKAQVQGLTLATAPTVQDAPPAELSEEEIAARKQASVERTPWVREAAKTIVAGRLRRVQLEALQKSGQLPSLELEVELEKIWHDEEVLMSTGDEVTKSHLRFAIQMEAVRQAPLTRAAAEELVNDLCMAGRYRQAPLPEGYAARSAGNHGFVIFVGASAYIPMFVDEGKTASQRGLETELRKYFDRLRKKNPHIWADDEVDNLLRTGADQNMLKLLRRGEPGTYALYLPPRPGDPAGMRGSAIVHAHMNIPDKGLVIEIVRGAGSLEWMNERKKKFIPLEMFRSRDIPQTHPLETQKFLRRYMGILAAALASYRAGTKKYS